MKYILKPAAAGVMLVLPFAALAQTSLTTDSTGDSFLDASKPTANFGKAGTLAIAAATSPVGAIDTVMQFNLGSVDSQFNTTYGAGNWTVTGISLSLASNFGTANANPGNALLPVVSGGNFGIDWISYDGWLEGTGNGMGSGNTVSGAVTYNSVPTLLGSTVDSLGTFAYAPPGNNVYVNYALPLDSGLVTAIKNAGDVSFYFYAADNSIGYLFNSKDFGGNANIPELTLTVNPVPEPATLSLVALSFAALLQPRWWKRKK